MTDMLRFSYIWTPPEDETPAIRSRVQSQERFLQFLQFLQFLHPHRQSESSDRATKLAFRSFRMPPGAAHFMSRIVIADPSCPSFRCLIPSRHADCSPIGAAGRIPKHRLWALGGEQCRSRREADESVAICHALHLGLFVRNEV